MPGVEHINPSLIRQVVVSASKQLVLNYSCLAIYHLMAWDKDNNKIYLYLSHVAHSAKDFKYIISSNIKNNFIK